MRSILQRQCLRPLCQSLVWRQVQPASTSKGLSEQRFFSPTAELANGSAPFKVAIVGSGPSGCYTAKYLQASTQTSSDQNEESKPSIVIDILERLPTAYGLVRSGVAPDHPEVKNVQNDFDALFDNDHSIRFFGNVQVGSDVSLNELRARYDAVVLAYGCESDRSLSHLPGWDQVMTTDENFGARGPILSAREFVSWYNGHIDYEWVGPIVEEALASSSSASSKTQDIVVVGHGNVALDCARILAKTREELDPTDLTSRALDVLRPSEGTEQTRKISIVGRRGHIQGAFTIKELRELTKLPHADLIVSEDELHAGKATKASQEELEASRPRTRMDKLLSQAAADTTSRGSSDEDQDQVDLRFLLNPVGFEAASSSEEGAKPRLASVICERTKLVGAAGKQQADGTGEMEHIPAQLALISIGYKGVAIPGTEEWFDQRQGTLNHTHGRVDASKSDRIGGLYTSGWLKRGPSGIIGTNIADAKDTVATIIHDLKESSLESQSKNPPSSLEDLLQERGVVVVDWQAYQKINAKEIDEVHKRHPDQPREKLTTRAALLEAAVGRTV